MLATKLATKLPTTPTPTLALVTATSSSRAARHKPSLGPTPSRHAGGPVGTVGIKREPRLTPQALTDLRKPVSNHARDVIVARAEFLPDADRALLQAVYAQGQTLRHLALLSRSRPSALSRRLRVLVARVLHPAFAVVVARSEGWPKSLRAVGEAIYVRGLTIRDAARACKITFTQARAGKDAIAAIVTDATQPSPADVRVLARNRRGLRDTPTSPSTPVSASAPANPGPSEAAQ